MPTTATQGTGVGIDLGMVAGATTAGKRKVPTKQRRLAVAGGAQDDKVAEAFAKVRANVSRQLKYAEEGGGAHWIKCPVKSMFTLQMSEVSDQEKNKCLLCDVVVGDNFSNRLMHLLGNDKNDGRSGYKGETIEQCAFVDETIMSVMLDDLKKVMVAVPIRQHDKAWDHCVEVLHRMTTENSSGDLSKSIVPTCMSGWTVTVNEPFMLDKFLERGLRFVGKSFEP